MAAVYMTTGQLQSHFNLQIVIIFAEYQMLMRVFRNMLRNHCAVLWAYALEMFTCNCEYINNLYISQALFENLHYCRVPFFIIYLIEYILSNISYTPHILL